MMFRGAYSTEFYRELADALHAEVRGGEAQWDGYERKYRREFQDSMDLLLTHGYFLADDPKEREIMKPYAPLGLLYLSSHLRPADSTSRSTIPLSVRARNCSRLIETERPRVVGIYGNLMTRANVLAIANAARENGCRVMLGGPEPPNYPEEYLDAGADAIVNGEGEVSLEALLRAFAANEDLSRVPGIQYRGAIGGGQVVRTRPAPLDPES